MTLSASQAHVLRWKAFTNIFPSVPDTLDALTGKFVVLLLGPGKTWIDLVTASKENNEIIDKLRMLAGPHGQTIWKAMQVKNDSVTV